MRAVAADPRIERMLGHRDTDQVGDPGPARGQVAAWQVGRVAAVAESRDVAGGRRHRAEQHVARYPGPDGVQLRPFRHAVDVGGHGLGRQRTELLPRPRHRRVDRPADCEAPLRERGVRRRPCRQHAEVAGDVLTGRNARRIDAGAPATDEAARGWCHRSQPSAPNCPGARRARRLRKPLPATAGNPEKSPYIRAPAACEHRSRRGKGDGSPDVGCIP